MANWISSRLKVAENLLQQLDQQAAESLRKGERKPSDCLDLAAESPKLSISPSLKDQLKKKPAFDGDDNAGRLGLQSSGNRSESVLDKDGAFGKRKVDMNVKTSVGTATTAHATNTVKDSDWTELLSTPKQSVSKANRASVSGLKKVGRRVGGNVKSDGKGGGRARRPGEGDHKADKASAGAGDRSGSDESRKSESSLRVSGVEGSELVQEIENKGDFKGNGEVMRDRDAVTNGKSMVKNDGSQSVRNGSSLLSGVNKDEGASAQDSDAGREVILNDDKFRKANLTTNNGDVANHFSGGVKDIPHMGSDQESESESDSESGSSSDSEDERRREERRQRRRQILAAKATAKALEAIKEQENIVARLEGEKQSLEKILEERAKQAALEASELQSTMMETMEAAELEKQKHNHTRMEILTRLAKLETANAGLAKSLAVAQWNLETEVNNLTELRQQVDMKEATLEGLKKNASMHQTRTSLNSLVPSRAFELEKEMLEAEYSLINEKTVRLQEKVTMLEADIDLILKEMGRSTEVEVELKRRLCQMTDHLIQKQAQVEALSSDKATLLFRIEAVSRLLDENQSLISGGYTSGSLQEDIEAGRLESTSSKLRPGFKDKLQSGRRHLGSLVRQLDAIFSAGALFLSRNQAAKLWSSVYLVCLHLWVLYILFSHSQSTEDSISSSVVSLENINTSIGV